MWQEMSLNVLKNDFRIYFQSNYNCFFDILYCLIEFLLKFFVFSINFIMHSQGIKIKLKPN